MNFFNILIEWFPIFLPMYLVRFTIGPFPTTLLEIIFWILLIGVTYTQGVKIWHTGFIKSQPWLPAIGIWILASSIAIFIAPNHIAALGLWRAYILEPILFFILLNGLQDEKLSQKLIRSFIIAGCGIFIWTAIQYFFGIGIPHPWDTSFFTRRATGPFPYPNAVALFCTPIAALCAGKIIWNQRQPKIIFGFFSCTLAIIFAHSVGGIIAMISTALFGLILNKKTRKIGLISITCLLIAYVIAPTKITSPITHTLTFQDWSGYVRIRMWKDTFSMLKDHSIFGAGLGAYPAVFKKYQTTTGIEIFQYPHNILLNIWSEMGILGIIGFIAICITWIKFSYKKNPWMLLPLIAILIHGLVDVPYFKNDLAFAFWIFMWVGI